VLDLVATLIEAIGEALISIGQSISGKKRVPKRKEEA
jgi:hypothetical protein